MAKSTLFGRQAAVIMMDQSASSAPIAAQAGALGCGWKWHKKSRVSLKVFGLYYTL